MCVYIIVFYIIVIHILINQGDIFFKSVSDISILTNLQRIFNISQAREFQLSGPKYLIESFFQKV